MIGLRQPAMAGARMACVAFALALLSACASAPRFPRTQPPPLDVYPAKLNAPEPAPREVVIIVNDNVKMVHAGMFAGSLLLDPAGSYVGTRKLEKNWRGTSLQDYLNFQLEDGPDVKVYRFDLPPQSFSQIETRVKIAGGTLPLFCAAKVQNMVSGIPPFESVPDAWLVSPATVADYLDEVIARDRTLGTCRWPNGESCYPAR